MNLKQIKKEIIRLDSSLTEESPEFKAGVVLMSSVFIGPNIKKLASFCGYSRPYVAQISKNLRKSKVWSSGKVYHSGWEDKTSGGVAFWMDVCVAMGFLHRTQVKGKI